MDNLLNISPVDGRYHETTKELSNYFSEYALIKYRIFVEIKWLIYLLDKKILDDKITNTEKEKLLNIYNNFNLSEAHKVKDIESTIKHDVKAIEYYLRDKFKELKLARLNPFIHIMLTSEDVNNVSYNLMIKDTLNNLLETTGEKPAVLFSLIRLSVSFAPFSPALDLTLNVLGKDITLARLHKVKEALLLDQQ